VVSSFIGRVVLLGYTWALVHHMLGGIRHLVWDTGRGLERRQSRISAYVVVAASVAIALVIACGAYLAGTRGP